RLIFCVAVALALSASGTGERQPVAVADAPQAFEGEKTSWRGFDRYDFLLDEQKLTVEPAKGKGEVKGKRRCIVVAPKKAAQGKPWSWRGFYWDHEPQAEVELLQRGFHAAHAAGDQGKQWDSWYALLTT